MKNLKKITNLLLRWKQIELNKRNYDFFDIQKLSSHII